MASETSPPCGPGMRDHAEGFTLIEMMIVLAVLAILVIVGVPTFSEATLNSRLNSYSNNLLSSIYLARSEAVKRNLPITLCTSTNGTSCATSGDWEQGWIVLEPASSAVLQHQQALPSGYKVSAVNTASAAIYSIQFQPSGISAANSKFTVWKNPITQYRWVCVSATGRPQVRDPRRGDVACF